MAARAAQSIFLAGMMGAGKSRLGRDLAQAYGRVFIDLDDEIERESGRAIEVLLPRLGEADFRRLEREVLLAVLELPNVRAGRAVVALGGGTVLSRPNVDAIARVGALVWLDVGVDTLVARLAADRRVRPLLSAPARRQGTPGPARPASGGADAGQAAREGELSLRRGSDVGSSQARAAGEGGAITDRALAERVSELMAARRARYEAAGLRVDADGEPSVVLARVVALLGLSTHAD